MSTVSGISSDSSSVAYATQLAQTSQLQRSLYTLGVAVQEGDLTSAGATLTALMQAYPQYASSSGSSDTSDPVNADFDSLSNAIDNSDASGAKAAWQQLKTDLGNEGVAVNNGSESTAQLLANANASLDQSILSQTFGVSADISGGGDGLSSILSNWITYQATGATTATSSSTNLNTTA
ncbi:MAG: hypothetical protein ACLQVX_06560 [Limisphaerales bacterium]